MERGHREPRVGDRERVRHAVDLGEKEETIFRGRVGVAGTRGEGLLGLRRTSQETGTLDSDSWL